MQKVVSPPTMWSLGWAAIRWSRNEAISNRAQCPSFGYQTIQILIPKELEFPQESRAGRRKRLNTSITR